MVLVISVGIVVLGVGPGSESTVPETVMTPPGVRVCEPITMPEEAFSVKVCEPMITIGRVFFAVVREAGAGVTVGLAETDAGEGVMVAPLMITAPEEPTEICWPETVAMPPGEMVCEPITTSEWELREMVCEPKRIAEAALELAGWLAIEEAGGVDCGTTEDGPLPVFEGRSWEAEIWVVG